MSELQREDIEILGHTRAYQFSCPLPKGYLEIKKKLGIGAFERLVNAVKDYVNEMVQASTSPFDTFLEVEYGKVSGKRRKDLLSNCQITRVFIDDRGVYGVYAGNDINSGDIHLNTSADFFRLRKLQTRLDEFEKRTLFLPHNVDYYWQAVLLREFCVQYFNQLVRWSKSKKVTYYTYLEV